MLQALPSDLQRLFRTNVIRTWMDVIEHYTKRGLTKKTDKLPAISAVARKAFDIQKCDYLAGLWKNDLVYELGWMPNFSERPSQIPGEGREVQWDDATYSQEPYPIQVLYRAPSWSWASVDGGVAYAYNNDNIGTDNNHPLIEYIGHEIELSNAKDLYGEVIGGYLTVKAQTIMVTLTESPPVGGPRPISQTTQVSVNEHIVNTQGNVYRDDLNGIFAPDPHNALAMPLLLSFSLSSGFLLTCLLLEEKEQNVYKWIGALNWQSKKAKLESDSGLKQIMSKLGKIEWDVGSYIRFERDMTQLQEIKIV